MNSELLQRAEKYNTRHRRKKLWQKAVSTMACIVMFCTTYALILPAITQESRTFCGVEAHEHTDSCYTKMELQLALACSYESLNVHQHTAECYAATGELQCLQADYLVHSHDAACFDANGELICQLPERDGHIHSQQCYETQGAHTHDAACYGEKVLICTETEEHQHTDACYEQPEELLCGLEESAGESKLICTEREVAVHVHNDDCYAQPNLAPVLFCELPQDDTHQHTVQCYGYSEMTCGLEAHQHELICYSDKTADLESPEDWAEMFAGIELSGVWADDLLRIAESQLGYCESEKNYIVMEDGETILGYTRYGDWYGLPYGDWCAMFVSYCLNYAGIGQKYIPYEAGCFRWMEALEKREMLQLAGDYTPKKGDLIFFDNDFDGSPNHVGIVSAFDGQKGILHTIEGNNGLAVDEFDYAADDPRLMAYGVLPTNPFKAEQNLANQTITATIYTDGTYSAVSEDQTLITISGILPEGAYAKAYLVELDETLIVGETVLLAYDITIFDAAGRPFEQSTGKETFKVTIQPENWSETDREETDYNVYYIPEEGTPEMMDTAKEDAAVSFITEHFSTYALTAGGTMSAVYLNGSTGNDSAAGSRTAPVKTLEKAVALAADGGTINISGTVTVSKDLDLTLTDNGVTIKRLSSFTGPLITVANGACLTLGNVTINGGTAGPSSSNIATTTTYASGSAKAPLIVVNTGGELIINDGAVLEYNSNKPDTNSSGTFKENGYVGQGGAIYCTGTLTMNGGRIQYCEAQSGGGIYVDAGTFNLHGGTIDHNYARDINTATKRKNNFFRNAGGGVYINDNSTMTMTGGTVSYNQSSREGGGISLGWLDRSAGSAVYEYTTTFTMTGGTLTQNTATSTGGGLNITAGCEAYIVAGYITNNKANGREYQHSNSSSSSYINVFSGGGIYLDASQWDSRGNHAGVPAKAVINRVLITDNTASAFGGGIASCSTSETYVNVSMGNGTAIYENTASTGGNEIAINGGSFDVSDKVLGGGSYGWSKKNPDNSYYWTRYDNSLTDSSPAIQTAKTLATVYITGNSGYDGGGIGCNGVIEIGGETDTVSISITKIWDDDGTVQHPEFITVQVLQNGKPYGDPVTIYPTVDDNGNEIWPTYYVDRLPEGYTYTIEEIPVRGFESSVSGSDGVFTITNTPKGFSVVKKWVNDTAGDRPGSIQVQLYQNGVAYGDTVELTAANNWSYTWNVLPEGYTYTAKEVTVPAGYYSTSDGQLNSDGDWEITNTKSETTTVSVEKQWADGSPGAESVTVQLCVNGVPYGNSVELNAGNGWFHLWDGIPVLDTAGNPNAFTVEETAVNGYISSVTLADRANAPKTWSQATALEAGNTYLFVSDNGALAGNGSGGLQWIDVSANIAAGTMPANDAVWRYDNQRLQNAAGNYLTTGSYFSVSFGTGSSGDAISYSDGTLSCSAFLGKRYFSGISSGSGTATNSSSSAVKFTLYKLSDSSDNWGDTHYIVTNTRRPDAMLLNFVKKSTGKDAEGNVTVLGGAEFALYRAEESDTVIPGTDVTGTLIDQWVSESDTGTNDGIHTSELGNGTYYLVENKPPAGHIGLAKPIIFEVNVEAKSITLVRYSGYDGFLEIDPSGGVKLNGYEVSFPVYNVAAYLLPETGGFGTTAYTIGGLTLMIGAAAILLYNYSKRRREDQLPS